MLSKLLYQLFSVLLLAGLAGGFSSYGEWMKRPVVPQQVAEVPFIYRKFPDLVNWQRPEGPVKIALQVGHLNSSELPDELERLRLNSGTSGGGKIEWEVNWNIAQQAKKLLEAEGYLIDILPATVPKAYWADIFVSIHADGNLNYRLNGFKVAASNMDYTGKAQGLAELIEKEYANKTKMPIDSNITDNMRFYYAFNWRRFNNSIHPMTTAVILETGYLTSPKDRRIIVNNPKLPALALTESLVKYIKLQGVEVAERQ